MSEFLSNIYVCELTDYTRAKLAHLRGVRYICVPWAWISMHNGNIALFRYPDEEPVLTRERIMNEAQFDRTWELYPANVVIPGNISYEPAVRIVDLLEAERGMTAAQAPQPVVNEATSNVVKDTRDGVCAATENTQNQPTLVQILSNVVLKNASNHPPVTIQNEQPNVPTTSSTDQSAPTPNHIEQLNVPNTKSTDHSAPTTNHIEQLKVPKSSAAPEQPNVQYRNPQLLDLGDLQEIIKCRRSETAYIENFIEEAKYVIRLVNESNGCVVAPQIPTSGMTTNTPRAPPIRKRSSSVSKSADETPSKKKPETLPFDLPANYNPNDTRWTLRFSKRGPGLKKLAKNIYVNAEDYKYCISKARNNNELIYMLLAMIFNDEALRVCSITGTAPNGFSYSQVRPALDQNALNILVSIVQDFVEEKLDEEPTTWPDPEPCRKTIFSTIRYKLQKLRNLKHAQEDKAKPHITPIPTCITPTPNTT